MNSVDNSNNLPLSNTTLSISQLREILAGLDALIQSIRGSVSSSFDSTIGMKLKKSKKLFVVLAAVDTLYLVIQYALFPSFVDPDIANEKQIDPIVLLVSFGSVIAFVLAIIGVLRDSGQLVTVFLMVQSCTIILAVRMSLNLWSFLMVRSACLMSTVHLRLIMGKADRIKSRLNAAQRALEGRYSRIRGQVETSLAVAEGRSHPSTSNTTNNNSNNVTPSLPYPFGPSTVDNVNNMQQQNNTNTIIIAELPSTVAVTSDTSATVNMINNNNNNNIDSEDIAIALSLLHTARSGGSFSRSAIIPL